jgi:hypothetical protein
METARGYRDNLASRNATDGAVIGNLPDDDDVLP